MNKSAIVRIVIWSVVAMLLSAFLVSALTFDILGSLSEYFNFGSKLVHYDEKDYNKGNFTTADDINTFQIYWISGNVDLSFYNGSVIKAEESSDYNIEDDNTMRYRVKDGVLTIHPRKSGMLFHFGKRNKKRLTVQIPQSLAGNISLILIDSVSARINLQDLSANKFRLKNVSGDVLLCNSNFESIDIENVSGDIKCNDIITDSLKMDTVSGQCEFVGSVQKIDFDSVSGDIDIDSSVFPREIDTDTVSGNAGFQFPTGDGFTADLDSVSGELDCNVPLINNKKSFKYGDGSAKYDFESVSGDVTIHIKEDRSSV